MPSNFIRERDQMSVKPPFNPGYAAAVLLSMTAAMAVPKKPVLGFYPNYTTPNIDYTKLTHIMFAFAVPGASGEISNPFIPADVVTKAHAAGVKVIVSVGGAQPLSLSDAFRSIAANATARSNFAKNAKSLCDTRSVDGIDIDWEYPRDSQDSTNLTLLLKDLRAALGTKLITMDVAADGEKGIWVGRSAVPYIDFLNVMSYDYTGEWAGSPQGQHAPYNKAVTGMGYWRVRGFAKTQLILGVPFYGKRFPGGSPVKYSEIAAANPSLSPDADSVGTTWFNGPTTIKKKATYVAQNSFGGIMVWELSQDAPSGPKSLMDAIQEGLKADPLTSVFGRSDGAPVLNALGRSGKVWLSLTSNPATFPRLRDMRGRAAFSPTLLSAAASQAAGAYIIQPEQAR